MLNSSEGGTDSVHGVRHVSPCVVRASAPAGSDSIVTLTVVGLTLNAVQLGTHDISALDDVQAASPSPQAATAITCLMVMSVPPGRLRIGRSCGPRPKNRGLFAMLTPSRYEREEPFLDCGATPTKRVAPKSPTSACRQLAPGRSTKA
jgi:hypothetical protein